MIVLVCETPDARDHENAERAFDWLRGRYARFWSTTHSIEGERLRERIVGIRHEGRCLLRLSSRPAA